MNKIKLSDIANVRALVMVFALLAICVFFHIVTKGVFLSPGNIANVIRQSSIVGILAIGLVLVIVSGNIDLSVGSLVGLFGGISAMLTVKYHFGLGASIALTLFFGMIVGALQGSLVAYLRIPSFIVTLGGLLIFRGTIMALMKGLTFSVDDSFKFFGSGFLSTAQGWIVTGIAIIVIFFTAVTQYRSRKTHGLEVGPFWLAITRACLIAAVIIGFMFIFESTGNKNAKPVIASPIKLPETSPLFNTSAYQLSIKQEASLDILADKSVPVPVIIIILLALLFSFIAMRTTFGRRIFAIGGNSEAAFLSGIRIKWNTMLVFAISSLMSAIAGIVYTARLGSAAPDAAAGYELYAVAACVIGGTSLMGGKGTIFGAIIGALIMGSLDSGMSIMNIEPFYQNIIKGAVLILAVYLDVASKKGK